MKVEILRRDCPSRSLISIRSARVGGDDRAVDGLKQRFGFQSTPPVWAETGNEIFSRQLPHFNPLRPCGRRQQKKPFFRLLSISITTYFTEKKQENSM